jgi:RIO kinase 1
VELVDEGIIDDVLSRLLSGKEASIFVVEKGGEVLAAKVYKAREQRTFKHVSSYVAGRNQTRNTRDRRAKQRRSNYGKELIEKSWREMEMDALQRAYYAGVRVPQPFLLSGDVLLMELLTDETGGPAPRLADLELNHTVAKLLHEEVFLQVRRLLSADLIHGDLSAYNILYTPEGCHLIDLPQAVDASANREARDILHRDLMNVTEHLAKFDARLLELRDCGAALFDHYEKGTLDRAVAPEGGSKQRRRGQRGNKRKRPPVAPGAVAREHDHEHASGQPEEAKPAHRSSPRGSHKGSPKGSPRSPQKSGHKRGPVIERKPAVRPASPPAAAATDSPADGGAPKKKRRRRRRRRPPSGSEG